MRVGVLCSECGDYRTPCRCDMIPKEELVKIVDEIQTGAIEYDDVIVYPGWSVGDVLKRIGELLNREGE